SLLQNDYHTSPNLCRTSYTKAILALGFYLGMVEVLQARKVTWREEVSVPARQFKDTFKNIYHKFGLPLNYTFLGNEINSLENKIKKTKLEPEKWYTVATLEQRKPGNPDKRNFFAHSGMEKNLTEFLASPAEIYFCYTHQYIDQQGQEQDSISLIKKWLREEV
ncbi:MAG: TM1812 family CRISPR-associated protein, partial [Bacillota bacterium]